MTIQRSLRTRMAGAMLLAAFFLVITTLPTFAQDSAPPEPPPSEEPAAPPPPPIEEQPALPEAETEPRPPAPGETIQTLPLSAASDLGILATPNAWFTCASDTVDGLADGKCNYPDLPLALNDFAARSGSGTVKLNDSTFTADYSINAIPKLTGVIGVGSQYSPQTVALGWLEVANQGAFTLKGIYFNNTQPNPTLNLHDNTGNLLLEDLLLYANPSGPALDIYSQSGNVTLKKVQADQNTATLIFYNFIASIAASGNVNIQNSSFNNNTSNLDSGNTVYLSSGGKLALDGVSVSNNTVGNGLVAYALKGVTIKNSAFNYNRDTSAPNAYGNGLLIDDTLTTSILLDQVAANGNQISGFSIIHNGSVTARNLTASDNGANGIYLNLCNSSGGACQFTNANNLTLTVGVFRDNYTGVFASVNGSILLDGITSDINTDFNASLTNADANKPRPVTIHRSIFDDAVTGIGLEIASKGAITLNQVSASENASSDGASLSNIGGIAGVTILGKQGRNRFSGNKFTGLSIVTQGNVAINNMDAVGNGQTGILIDNVNTNNVSLTSVLIDQNGWFSPSPGLKIENRGSITLKDVTSIASTTFGVELSNTSAPAGKFPFVNITGGNFSINQKGGLEVRAAGNITLTNTSVDLNNSTTDPGALLITCHTSPCLTNRSVTVNGGSFTNNAYTGLSIRASGNISIKNVSASGNQHFGIALGEGADPLPASITLVSVGAYNNLSDNLYLRATGNLTLSKVVSNYSLTGNGAYMDGCVYTTSCAGSGKIKVTDSSFSNNNKTGLYILANNAVNLSGITGYQNGSIGSGSGVYISNSYQPGAGVSVSKGVFQENANGGLLIYTEGAVVLNGINASYNLGSGLSGVFIGGNIVSPTRKVTLFSSMGANHFDGNTGVGIFIYANNGITLANFTASGNGRYGVGFESTGAVSILNAVTENNNDQGIYGRGPIVGASSVTLKNVRASYNGTLSTTSGIFLENVTGSKITVLNSIAMNNARHGIEATFTGPGTLTVKNTLYYGNDTSVSGFFNLYTNGTLLIQ